MFNYVIFFPSTLRKRTLYLIISTLTGIPGLVNTVPLLYDTGAGCSLINKKIFRKLHFSNRPRKVPIKIRAKSASGNTLKLEGCYLFEVKILNKTVFHPLFVCSNIKSNGIVGQDFIRHHGLSFCAQSYSPYFVTPTRPKTAILAKSVYLPARSATMAPVQVENLGQQTLAINVPGCPQIFRNEVLIEACSVKKHNIYLTNVSTMPQKLPRGTPVGVLEDVSDSDITPWYQGEAFSVSETSPTIPASEKARFQTKKPVLTKERRKEIINQTNLSHLPPNLADKYLSLILNYHYCISIDEFDVGKTNAGMHSIPLIDESKAIFEKQFPLPIKHRIDFARQVKELLRLGLVSRIE